MIFHPDLIKKVLRGEKTVTRRLAHLNYRLGVTSVQPGRGKRHVGHIKILLIWQESLGALSEAEARLEGFDSAGEFVRRWFEIHGRYDSDEPIQRIVFEPIARCPDCITIEESLSPRPAPDAGQVAGTPPPPLGDPAPPIPSGAGPADGAGPVADTRSAQLAKGGALWE